MYGFGSFYKSTENRKYNTWCKYTTRIDTYGCGCQHDCSYCYSKSLLNFRGLWNAKSPRIAYVTDVINKIQQIPDQVVKLGGMSDCFQPLEKKERVTYNTIKALNKHNTHYLIVTKSSLVSDDDYIKIYNKDLAHFQITITATSNKRSLEYEKASSVTNRIKSIEKLYKLGFDVSVRLSPFIINNIDFKLLNNIKCNKILIEFLKVNHWIKKWFDIDYDKYTLKYGGYSHLPLDDKIEQIKNIDNFDQISVGEYVKKHHSYFRDNVNYNNTDCCNLNIKLEKNKIKQLKMEI